RRSPFSEQDVAHMAIQLARDDGSGRRGVGQAARDEGRAGRHEGEGATNEKDDGQCSLISRPSLLAARPSGHVGYYLIDQGRSTLEDRAGMRSSLWMMLCRLGGRKPLLAYLSGVLLITAGVTAGLLALSLGPDAH